MQAIIVKQFGGPEALQLSEISQPQPSAQQLLIRVHACGVNRADVLQRGGNYPPPPGESEILGLEIAGEVAAFGSEVTRFSKGQRVCGLVGGGAYAEYCVIDQQLAMPIPGTLSYQQAASIQEAFLTAYEAIFTLATLQAKQTILIHAGASGVGLAAIQLAKAIDATVIATAGSEEKCRHIKQVGADLAIHYRSQDFVDIVSEFTAKQGIDVIIDFIGKDYLQRNLHCLARRGRLILVATLSGSNCEIDLLTIIRKQLQIKGLIMRSRPLSEKRDFTKRFQQEWLPKFDKGILKPVIDSVYPLAEAAKAHQRMELNQNIGKIILVV